MENQTCQAVTNNGRVCGKRCTRGQWCGLHANVAERLGGAAAMAARNAAVAADVAQRNHLRHIRNHRLVWHLVNHALRPTRYSLTTLLRNVTVNPNVVQPWLTYFTGLFPRINQVVDDIYNDVPGAMTAAHRLADTIEEEVAEIEGVPIVAAPAAPAAPPPDVPMGELARFARDNQNVHTTVMVKQTKEVIERVLKIKVPKEYSYKTGHRTLAEIMMDVPMSDRAADWFAGKYLKHDTIYEYKGGIFAKVTDAVWQYVRNSPDKADLCRIMRTELEDNVGMCAQGNLTRMCNVLAGYLDGINTESPGEQLQRRMAALMEMENEAERVARGKDILQELAVPAVEWQPWLEALA